MVSRKESNWIEAGKDAFKTTDDRYSVCRVVYVDKTGPQPRWEAWRGKATAGGVKLGAWISQEEARKACGEGK